MLKQYPIENILFIDIETVPQYSSFDDVSVVMQELWDKKSKYFRNEDQSPADVYQRAGIYAEFGKIICISAGIVKAKNGTRFFRVKSFAGEDEKQLLLDFSEMLNAFSHGKERYMCGHNSKEFDFPYIARRMLINGVELPAMLDVAGKKPWEVKFLDTLDLWKFGDYKHYTSLNLLTAIFNIPSPKDDIDGSQVADVFYLEKDIQRIAVYCEKDVLATAQLFLRFKGESLLDPQFVERVF
ncbi:3'-5' exonuclease [Marinilabiliaceae bacterium JC017]|nr:3'-5' exonuclease [Marinilabiliaceae bacterium JC017]